MNSDLSDRLRGFQLPSVTPLPQDQFLVVRLRGIDFESIFASPEFEFDGALDSRFAKMMVCTVSHLLGGDACGRYGFTELAEFSLLLDHVGACERWKDATALQNFLVGMASSKMTQQLETEAIFLCQLYAFPTKDLVLAYFCWRQQEAYLAALDGYCSHVLLQNEENSPDQVARLVTDLAPQEKEEILRQHDIDYGQAPTWQRNGVGVHLSHGEIRVVTELPSDDRYEAYVDRYLY